MNTCMRALGYGLLAASVLIGCHGGAHTKEDAEKLEPRSALQHAVDLANQKCLEQLGAAPFDSSSYEARFDGERWRWGSLGVHGIKGYSALVSFDPYGDDDSVTVQLNVDRLESGAPDSIIERARR